MVIIGPLGLMAQCLTGDCQNQLGELHLLDGSIFKGVFRHGAASGSGIVEFDNGFYFEGACV